MKSAFVERSARDIMSTHVVAVNPKDTIRETLGLMYENGLSSLPVVSGDNTGVGMISSRDILEWAKSIDDGLEQLVGVGAFYADMVLRQVQEDGQGGRVEELMSDVVVSARPDDSINSIIDSMLRYEIHHLPVLDDNQKLIGILSTIDVLRAIRKELQAE